MESAAERVVGEKDSIALVMSGGGALGAYEAGAVLYLFEELARDRECRARFDVFTGTSVGALNASFLAANADDPCVGARKLVDFWESLSFDKIVRFGSTELSALARLGLGKRIDSSLSWTTVTRPERMPHQPVAGFFDATPLYEQIRETVPWEKLQKNIARGIVRGVALCATEVCTGTSVVFYQASDRTRYREGRDPSREARPVTLGVEHAMASAALPFFFPSIQIDGVCYTDGSLRQNTPLNPALRMDADRVLVISLRQDPRIASHVARLGCRRNPYPGTAFLFGRILDAFLAQSLDYELHRVEMYNALIEGGCEIYGEEFLDNLNRIMGARRNASFRPVKTCHVRPSHDPLQLARRAMEEAPDELSFPGLAGKVVEKILGSTAFVESELFSYMLFTPRHVRLLLDMGYHDARENRGALLRLMEE
jgi:NTE family protein